MMVEPVDGWAEALAADRRRPDAHWDRLCRRARPLVNAGAATEPVKSATIRGR
jgi:hypothetical protein